MNRKEASSLHQCHTTGSGQELGVQTSYKTLDAADEAKGSANSSSLKSSEKSAYDSRLNDSGVWSGSNIQSEELFPESPRSGEFRFSSEKVVSENKSYMRLDSGIDVSVSRQFSELSLKDVDTYNDLNDPPSKAKETTTPSTNINDQFTSSQKCLDPSTLQKQALLDTYFQQNEDGDTELHLAVIHKFIETVYALVRMVPHPKYLNLKNSDRQTALHMAVLTGQPRLVRLLVCAGAALDTLDRCGYTALHLAVAADDLACTRAIIDPVTTPETQVAQLQYSPYEFHTRVNVADIYNYDGQTCAHLAALNGNIEILRYLLWYGANINAKEWKGGETCLHLAVGRGDSRLCVFLLGETSINVEEESYAGLTACQAAWGTGIADTLQQHGVPCPCLPDDTDSDSDDDMVDCFESGFGLGFQVNGGGLVNVGA